VRANHAAVASRIGWPASWIADYRSSELLDVEPVDDQP